MIRSRYLGDEVVWVGTEKIDGLASWLAGANKTRTMKDFQWGNHTEQADQFDRKKSFTSIINLFMIH